MTRTQPRSLDDLQYRPTSYEVVAISIDGTRTRLGFTTRTTRKAMLDVMADNIPTLDALLDSDDWRYEFAQGSGKKTRCIINARLEVRFGETEWSIASRDHVGDANNMVAS